MSQMDCGSESYRFFFGGGDLDSMEDRRDEGMVRSTEYLGVKQVMKGWRNAESSVGARLCRHLNVRKMIL